MLPNINIFGKEISFYTISIIVGAFVVLAFHQINTKKKGYDEIFMLFILLFSMIGIFVGGHILYAISMTKYFFEFIKNIKSINSFNDFIDWMITIFGGSIFYGGMLGGIFTSYLYIRTKKSVNIDPYVGIGTLCIPLFHIFGRIGCFLSGCCYGIPSSFGINLYYSTAPNCAGVDRFPVQLLESFCNLLLFVILFYLFNYRKMNGKKLLNLYLCLYAIIRFFDEFLRGDIYRGFVGFISLSQYISISILVILFTYELSMIINKKYIIKSSCYIFNAY